MCSVVTQPVTTVNVNMCYYHNYKTRHFHNHQLRLTYFLVFILYIFHTLQTQLYNFDAALNCILAACVHSGSKAALGVHATHF